MSSVTLLLLDNEWQIKNVVSFLSFYIYIYMYICGPLVLLIIMTYHKYQTTKSSVKVVFFFFFQPAASILSPSFDQSTLIESDGAMSRLTTLMLNVACLPVQVCRAFCGSVSPWILTQDWTKGVTNKLFSIIIF